ncbi:MAG: Rieske 2Fe-2S domain-containing protein [Bowdeniella nasicola]|nr:Rieske 2Fe-2S domain-containing protein [Bowdeniella nasicola]
MSTHHSELPSGAVGTDVANAQPVPETFENPGLPPHQDRMSDRDQSAAKRVERQVVALLILSIIAAIAGIVGYFAFDASDSAHAVRMSTLSIGAGLGFAMLLIGVAAVHWAKALMSDHEHVEERHWQTSDEETKQAALQALAAGAKDANIERRPVLKGALATAVLLAPLPFAVPLIGNLSSDWNISKFRHTAWANRPEGSKGRRLAKDPTDEPIRAADVTNGSVFHVIPHGLGTLPGEEHFMEEKAKAVVLLVRMDPAELKEADDRKDWSYDGIVAYSKICTHVGCPVALYEQQTKHLLCPCHQSTFDMTDGAKVVFGPAKRPLPQLPITVDDEGYLIATSDFHEPIGPSYWERLK